jgi:hypothetical protein
MLDMLLTNDGDLAVDERGDVALTNSVVQAVQIRLRWFLGEWRFAPLYGVPYYEEVLVKNPNIGKIRTALRNEAISVDEVIDAVNIVINADSAGRLADISMDIVTSEQTYRVEVSQNAAT